MKLSDITAKLTCTKQKVVKTLAAGALAAGIATLAAPHAQAQQFAIGVQFGHPHYVAPPPPRFYHDRYDRYRAYEFYRFHHDRYYDRGFCRR